MPVYAATEIAKQNLDILDPTSDRMSIGTKTQVETCLKFMIDYQTIGLIESEFAQEVLTVKSTHINAIPDKPSCILGILSRRRCVYWAIDLAMLIGLQTQERHPKNQPSLHEVILLSVHGLSLALVVPSISGLVSLDRDRLQKDVTVAPASMRHYLKGYVEDKGTFCFLLQAENIVRSAILHS